MKTRRKKPRAPITFGRWTVLGKLSGRVVLCRCSCGTKRIVNVSTLRRGKSRSCGCYRREWSTLNRTHGMSGTPTYQAWRHMINRCENPNDEHFDHYGGRGIKVCDRWRSSFEAFFEDMRARPPDRYSLDRIDNDRGYEPGNCRWATRKEQARNKRTTRFLEFRGERRPLVEWAEILGIPAYSIWNRIRLGWTDEEALTGSRSTA